MRIVIAGANSFIGKRLLGKASADNDIIAIVREGSSFKFDGAKMVSCDLADYGKLWQLCGPCDCYIDLTWMGSRGADCQNEEMQRMNYDATLASMKSMAEAGCKILVSSGSQAEYGQVEDVITEETPTNPNTEYGKYKLRIFNEVSELADKMGCRFIEPRYFSLYGPGDYEKTLIMATLAKLMKNDPVNLNECTQLWDYLFVDDAMDALLNLCYSDKAKGVYNFATGNPQTLKNFILEMKEAVNSKSEVNFGVVTYNGLYIDLNPDVTKLRTAANWEPKTSFKDGIRKIAGLKL